MRATPDGYTLLQVGPPNAYNASLYNNPDFNFAGDIAPIGKHHTPLGAMVVHPPVPAKTVPELIAYARADPGKITMASPGVGRTQHVWGELFKMMTGVEMVHVPNPGGGPALPDLLAGQVQVIFGTRQRRSSKSGRQAARAGGTTATRVGPRCPTCRPWSEFVPGYEATGWHEVAPPAIARRDHRQAQQ